MSTEFNGFEQPNHTQTPNDFFDRILPNIKYFSELKVLLAIIRQTNGWHKKEDRISLSQLQKLTGMKRQVVFEGIQHALEDGYIERRLEGQSFYYRLRLVTQTDQSPQVTSHPKRLEVVTQTDQQLVTQGDPQKKEIKKDKESSTTAKAVVAPSPQADISPPLNKAKKKKEVNPNLNHPAVLLYHDTFARWPTSLQCEEIINRVADFERWKQTLRDWALHPRWDKTNVMGMLDRYENGGSSGNNGTGRREDVAGGRAGAASQAKVIPYGARGPSGPPGSANGQFANPEIAAKYDHLFRRG